MKSLLTLSILALAATACGASTQFTSATSADGTKWLICFEVKQPVYSLSANVLACVDVESQAASKEAELKKLYPHATVQRIAAK